jgi:hypothetical protein
VPSSPSRSASGPSRLAVPRFRRARPHGLAVFEARPEHARILLSAAHRAPLRSSRSFARHASDPGHTWSPPRLVAGPSLDLRGCSQRRTLSGVVSHRAHGAVRSLEDCWPHARIAGNALHVAASARAVRVHFDELHPGFGREKPWTPSTTRVPSSLRALGLSDARITRSPRVDAVSSPDNRFMRCERMRLDQSALYE